MAKLSLQEQMLQAGLIDKKKMKKAGKSSKKSRTLAKEAKAAVEEKRAAQVAQDQELNRQKQQEAEKKAIAAQVKQLVEMNKIDRKDGDIGYNFTDGTLVKKIYVDKATQDQLVNGRLAIARDGEGYAIVPGVVADKIVQRDENTIVLNNTVDEQAMDEDDPYADFKIPDDLMW
ncbi:hypothetical protein RN22_24205 [Grimontia sp. AD028]|uniref:Nucleoprotein/polynucleotide-associated enzyme n=3 Tax=Grimontia TaxID=246861 RepID=R1IRX5_9GAMM|nr:MULTISPECIES: DUF2058 domain-containing protein [Grimontia]EOD78065.1 Nucleoprotein/polynucleotide-associated enzyme [Grimontia indica]KKD57845.1 hypothetical protein RN22_24205 [Grimontia sp. AD028]NGN98720.1 DUF2058 domain-containing protein [Grimontia sedimenti]CZF77636.1 hypothetical protein GCE9029_00326 [Grimontia celer]